MDKPLIVVEKIELTPEQQEAVQNILEGKPTKVMVETWKKKGVVTVTEKTYRAGSQGKRRDMIKKKFYKEVCCICAD